MSLLPEPPRNLASSRARSILTSRPNRSIYEQYAEEDRIVQRYKEQEENYRRVVERIQRKSAEREKQKHKGGLSLIYDRLMGMLWYDKNNKGRSKVSVWIGRDFDHDGVQDIVSGDIAQGSAEKTQQDEREGKGKDPSGEDQLVICVEVAEVIWIEWWLPLQLLVL